MLKSFKLNGRVIEPSNHSVATSDRITRLRPVAWDVLMFLVERRGEIVSIDVLLDEVWRDRSEEPAYVRKAVHEIRAALGDDDQQIVRNLPRVGYIIEPDAVEEEEAAGERPMTASSPLEQPLVYGSLSSDSYENISRRLRKTDQQDES